MRAISRQSGNVLFLILIAVALFAALSYVVTQSTRSGGGGADKEKMQMAFDHVLNHITSLRTAWARMTIAGVAFNAVNARYPLPAGGAGHDSYATDNTLCPAAGTNDRCKLYHPSGGGIAFLDFAQLYPELTGSIPASANPWVTSNVGLVSWNTRAGGTFEEDVTYSVHVTRPFCDYINKRLGVKTVDQEAGTGGLGTPSALWHMGVLNGNAPVIASDGAIRWAVHFMQTIYQARIWVAGCSQGRLTSLLRLFI